MIRVSLIVRDAKTGRIEVNRPVGRLFVNPIINNRKLPSRSWDHSFLGTLYGAFNAADTLWEVKDAAGSLRTLPQFGISPNALCGAGAGDYSHGIVIGTSTQAESVDDYHLTTVLIHGNTAGKVNYGTHSAVEPYVSGADFLTRFDRAFTGNAVDIVTVREIAAYVWCEGTTHYYCFVRDVDIDVGGTPIGVGAAIAFKLLIGTQLDFNIAFLSAFYKICSGANPTYAVYDTGHTDRKASLGMMGTASPLNDVTKGIVVGTDATAPTLNDYKLGSIIAGGGVGLEYGPQMFIRPTTDVAGGTTKLSLLRVVTNKQAGAQTIYEYGLYCVVPGGWSLCLLHTAVPAGVVLNQYDSKIIEYLFQTTV